MAMNQNKISIKVAEISINKFNDQIQHKVIQLRTFRISSSNSTSLNDLDKLRKDAINCLRVVKQLKQLLIEIDHLRSRTREEDLEKFDELTSKRREDALKEIRLYQGSLLSFFHTWIILTAPISADMKPLEKLNELSHHATSDMDFEQPPAETASQNLQIQLQVDDTEIRKREMESRKAL